MARAAMTSLSFYITDAQAKKLKAISERTGVPQSRIMRYGVAVVIEHFERLKMEAAIADMIDVLQKVEG